MINFNFSYDALDKNDYYSVLSGLDCNLLKRTFINSCYKTDEKSKYYIGKHGNGKFWNGFRINSVSTERIINSLCEDLEKNTKDVNKDININNLISDLIESQFKSCNDIESVKNEVIKSGDTAYISSIFKLLNIDEMPIKNIDEIKIRHLTELYEKKILTLEKALKNSNLLIENNNKKELEKLKRENEKIKKENDDLKLQTKKLKDEYATIKEKLFNNQNEYKKLLQVNTNAEKRLNELSEELRKIKEDGDANKTFKKLFDGGIKEQIKEKILSYLINKDFKSKTDIKEEIIRIINIINKEINQKSEANIESYILEIYILSKVLEG